MVFEHKRHFIFGGKNDDENKRSLELFKKINAVCENQEWHTVMLAIANLMQAGFDLAPENVNVCLKLW